MYMSYLEPREGPCAARFGRFRLRSVLKPMPDRDEKNGPNGHETPDSAAHYIATLTEELAQIARRNGLDTLSYILEMARLEADQVAKE
jgi:hypothetical protein